MSSHNGDTALELREVAAGYGGTPVVSDVWLDLPAGGWLAIVGPNGAGKSTLLKAIAGIIGHAGEIRLHGRSLHRLTRRQRAHELGYSPQDPSLPNGLTVTDYVLLGRSPHIGALGREGASDRAIAAEALGRLDLTDLAGRRLHTLSGGERQRTVLARVLAQRTRLLLLDEPTTGLDIGHAQALLELVDRLRTEDGTTVISTLHDLTFAAQYADRLVLVDEGGVAAAGTPGDVLDSDSLARHYAAHAEILGTTRGNPVVAPVRNTHSALPRESPSR